MTSNSSPAMKPNSKPFIENWIQSLTLVSIDPNAQRIKPLFDSINQLCRSEPGTDAIANSEKLWNLCASDGLTGLLEYVPTQQPDWLFATDDDFTFERAKIEPITTLEGMRTAIGVGEAQFAAIARVTSGDWTKRVRDEALRQRRSMSVTVFPDGKNLELPCHAHWDGKEWTIRFEQVDWVTVQYEDPFRTKRPTLESVNEVLSWAIANANDSLMPKQVAKLTQPSVIEPWFDCSPRLKPLHRQVLIDDEDSYAPWFRRTWAVVWPVVYREHNILRGLYELDVARRELAACITAVPRLTIWMFAFAKLVCLSQIGRGLGVLGDFDD